MLNCRNSDTTSLLTLRFWGFYHKFLEIHQYGMRNSRNSDATKSSHVCISFWGFCHIFPRIQECRLRNYRNSDVMSLLMHTCDFEAFVTDFQEFKAVECETAGIRMLQIFSYMQFLSQILRTSRVYTVKLQEFGSDQSSHAFLRFWGFCHRFPRI